MFSLHMPFCIALVAALVAWAPPGARAQPKAAPATIRVVTPPLTNYTPLIVARDKGLFAEENLSVSWAAVQGATLAVEAVYGGSAEVGGTGILESMVARGNGLGVMFFAAGARINSAPPDNSALVVRTGDTIQRPADLAGKKVSVGLVGGSINYIHMQEWLQKKGVDPKTIQFLEIPFSQMADALLRNRLDAVWAVEPFLTIMMQSGNARILAHPYLDNLPGMDITHYIAKESWLKANADVARRFKRAIDRATAHLNGAPKEERDGWVAKFSGVKPDLVAQMALPVFTSEFNVASLRANLDLAVQQKVVKPFDVNAMIWKP